MLGSAQSHACCLAPMHGALPQSCVYMHFDNVVNKRCLCRAVVYGFIILSTAVTVSINIKEFLAFLGMLLLMTAVMLYLYLPAATQLKGLRARTSGALVGLAAETLEGLKLVQAYRHEPHFIEVPPSVTTFDCMRGRLRD